MDDAFAELLLTDPEDEQPQMTSREMRIARAFEQSKQSYASETVVTPPGGSPEWSVQRLYLQKSYAAALQLAVEVLHAGGVELGIADNTWATPIHLGSVETDHDATHRTLPKNEARDREMLDVAMRCAIKLGDRGAAIGLAEATRSRWANYPGLAYTAGEAFVFANKPLDAISALLHAVRARTPSFSVLSLLAQSLNTAAESSEPCSIALKKLADIIDHYATRIKPAFERGLFPETTSIPDSKPPPKLKSTVLPESVVRAMGEEAGLGEIDIGLLVALCCTGDAEQDGGGGERSVRSL
ncbi:hypothetical protein FRC12_001076 [Ceratobasidium sp. 428]|nr:hypothetical protein FRC12_001076 [Ceratobasidium sp. 428]